MAALDFGPVPTDLPGDVTFDGTAPVGSSPQLARADHGHVIAGDPLVQGLVAHDDPAEGVANPVLIGGYASDVVPTAVSDNGDAVQAYFDRSGRQAVFDGGQSLSTNGLVAEATGILGAHNDAVTIPLAGASTVVFASMVANSANLNTLIEGSSDGGTTWDTTYGFGLVGGAGLGYSASPGTAIGYGMVFSRSWAPHLTHIRVRCSFYTSGDATFRVQAFANADAVGPYLVTADNPYNGLDNYDAPVPGVGALTRVFDAASGTWHMARGNATDGLLVNLGANNDVNDGHPDPQTDALTDTQLRASAVPVSLGGGVVGSIAQDASAIGTAPLLIGGYARNWSAPPTPVGTSDDAVQAWFLPDGVQVVAARGMQGYTDGTLGALNAAVAVDTHGAGTVLFRVNPSGLVGTIVFEAFDDVDWLAQTVYNLATGAGVSSVTNPTGDRWEASVGAFEQWRVRVSAYTSGSLGIVALTGSGLPRRMPVSATIDAAIPAGNNNIGDVDVVTLPVDPLGANADTIVAAGAAGSLSAKMRRLTQGVEDLKTGIIIAAGSAVIGTVTANAGSNLNTSALALETGGNLAAIAGAVRAEDAASADAHTGIPAMAVRKGTPANTSGTDGDYEMLQVSAGRLWASVVVDTALPAGSNAIGKLAANDGVDIGDVTINNASGAAAVNVQDGGNSITVDGTVTAANTSGDIASGSADSGNPVKVGGRYNSTLPTFTDGQRVDLQVGSRGSLHVELFGSGSANSAAVVVDNADGLVASGTANRLSVTAREYVFDGANWNRQRSVVAAQDSDGTGIAAAGILGQLDDVSTATVTENQFAPVRISARRALLIEGVASGTAVTVTEGGASTSAPTNVSASATSVTLLSANANRLAATIYNDSTSACYIKFGTTASTSSFTVKVGGGGYYEIPFNLRYTGRIDAIWDTATGAARITELTA